MFLSVNGVSHAHLQELLRFLGGVGDFARWNAHQPRWSKINGLREAENLKRTCLFCWVRNRARYSDSEWHALFDCPTCSAPRKRFRLAVQSFPSAMIVQPQTVRRRRIAIVSDLATFMEQCRKDERMVGELTRFVVDSMKCRQQAFRKLSVRDIFPTV